jgi:hypothetical protein
MDKVLALVEELVDNNRLVVMSTNIELTKIEKK